MADLSLSESPVFVVVVDVPVLPLAAVGFLSGLELVATTRPRPRDSYNLHLRPTPYVALGFFNVALRFLNGGGILTWELDRNSIRLL